jgi:DNA-directed RNA polymerase specialized sigma24 family protein
MCLHGLVQADDPSSGLQAYSGTFATTHWSVVLAAGQADLPEAREALENLCRTYWYPLYAYIRRRGSGHEDAQDLTQGFLLQLLEHDAFNRVEHSRGRFRSFLLASLNYYLADQRDHAGAIKRGAGQVPFPLDAPAAAERYRLEPPDNDSPDRLFERRWALTLLDQVLQRLGQEFQEAGKGTLFQRLQDFLVTGQAEARYPDAAADLGMSVDAVKKAAQRLRQRYYELFREEIAHTVAHPAEVEDELRFLCKIIAG